MRGQRRPDRLGDERRAPARAEGDLQGVVVSMRDITDRQAAEEALREAEIARAEAGRLRAA